MNIIYEDMRQNSQSLVGKRVVTEDGHMLLASIRRNSYDSQSYAKVERWNGEEWKLVMSFPIQEQAMYAHSYVQPVEEWSFHMQGDLYNILAETLRILGS